MRRTSLCLALSIAQLCGDEPAPVVDDPVQKAFEAFKDAIPPELLPPPEQFPRERNAWYAWNEIDLEELGLDELSDQRSKAWDFIESDAPALEGEALEQVRSWVAAHGEFLRRFEAAMALGRYRAPSETEAQGLPRRALRNTGEARTAWLASAGLHALARRFDAAAEDISRVLDLAELLSSGGFLESLLGLNARSLACRLIRRLAQEDGVPLDMLRELIAAVSQTPLAASADRFLRKEYYFMFLPLLLDHIAEGHERASNRALEKLLGLGFDSAVLSRRMGIAFVLEGHPQPIDSQATARATGQRVLALMAALRRPWSEQRQEPKRSASAAGANPTWIARALRLSDEDAAPDPDALLEAKRDLRQIENPLGKLLVEFYLHEEHGFLTGTFLRSARIRFRAGAESEATLAILGARLHVAVEGMAPPSLETLVEKGMLPRLPQDPYSSKALRYDAARGIVWSAGEDAVDDGGVAPPDDEPWKREGVDLIFPIDRRQSSASAR